MAISRCPNEVCKGTSFEAKELKVQKSTYRLIAVQCSSCGCVISVNEFFNIGSIVSQIAEELGIKF